MTYKNRLLKINIIIICYRLQYFNNQSTSVFYKELLIHERTITKFIPTNTSSPKKSYTLSQSTGPNSPTKKIKQPVKKYSTICTSKISAQPKSESRTNQLLHPMQNLDTIKTKKSRHQQPVSSHHPYLQHSINKSSPSMSTKSGSPREKTKNTRKQYIDFTKNNTTIFKQREQTSILRITKSYSSSMIDLLPSNFLHIADISSKTVVSNTK